MHYSLNILLGLSVACGSQLVLANQPSNAQIVKWITNIDKSNADPQRAITIHNTQPVTLYSGEIAYVSGVTFENSARNFWGGYVLTRPNLGQARILDFGGQANTFRVHSFYKNKKEFDLIEFESASSGQGTISEVISLTYINNWKVTTLRSVEAGSDGGRYNEEIDDTDCKTGYDNAAFFNIMPYNGIVIETTVQSNGCENKTKQDYKINSQFIDVKIP